MLLKLILSTPVVDSVIGKKGCNLQRFLTEFNCHVYAPNMGGQHGTKSDGLLYIEGVAESIVRCIEDILGLVSPYPLNKKTTADLNFIS